MRNGAGSRNGGNGDAQVQIATAFHKQHRGRAQCWVVYACWALSVILCCTAMNLDPCRKQLFRCRTPLTLPVLNVDTLSNHLKADLKQACAPSDIFV